MQGEEWREERSDGILTSLKQLPQLRTERIRQNNKNLGEIRMASLGLKTCNYHEFYINSSVV